jgi:hypothetical protein
MAFDLTSYISLFDLLDPSRCDKSRNLPPSAGFYERAAAGILANFKAFKLTL